MLTNAELTQMRADAASLLPDTCNILSLTTAPDGQGGQTETWGTATAGASCRLDPISNKTYGFEKAVGASLKDFHGFVLTLEYDASITTANRIEKGGETYNAVSVDTEKSWPITRRVLVERI